jgi:ribosomal protein L30/L7E
MKSTTNKKTVKKVVAGLKKASKSHAKQAKTLSSLKLNKGGSTVNKAGNYTKPTMRKNLFNRIKAGTSGGGAGQWSARKAQMLAKQYKAKGGGYR